MNLRIGDVILFQRKEQVVIFANASRALIIPLTFAVTWKDMPTGYTHFMAEGKGDSIAPTIEPEDLIRHMTVDELKKHFGGINAVPAGDPNQTANESKVSMKKTNQTAAVMAATATTAPVPAKTGKGRKPAAAAAPAAETPAAPTPRPSMKGTLVGRGKFVMDNAAKFNPAKEADIAEFMKLVNAAYPICKHPARWCKLMLTRANARIAGKVAKEKAAKEAAEKAAAEKKAAAAAAAEAAEKAKKEAAKVAAKAEKKAKVAKAKPEGKPEAPAANGKPEAAIAA